MSFEWYSLLAVLAGLGALFFFDLLSRARRPGGERGDYWTRVVWWLAIVLAPGLLLSAILRLFPPFWKSGWHLLVDLTSAFDLSQTVRYLIALGVPFAWWLLLLGIGLLRPPGGREAGRWLAGAVGYGSSRLWVLLCAVPLVLILIFNHGALNKGPHGYPGAAWGTVAVVLLSLIGVALSAGRVSRERSSPSARRSQSAPRRSGWPADMASRGVAQLSVAHWPAGPPPRKAGDGARELEERLRRTKAGPIAPELIEATAALLAPSASSRPEQAARLVFAPDDCGQVECVALLATLLQQRVQATTLVVVAHGAAELAARLGHWMPSASIQTVTATGEEPRAGAQVWVVDAETLSDRLLPKLKDPTQVNRVGLVVWWHLESYTGVLAANLWAISRRLHRLVRTQGRHDVRTLAFMRSAPHGSAQPSDFVRRLLPHPFPADTVVHVELRWTRPVELYELAGHADLFARGGGQNIHENLRHPTLVATMASVEAGWETHLAVPDDVADASDFLQLSASGRRLDEKLCSEPSRADVRLRALAPGEVLSLPEIISQGGRAAADPTAADPPAPHYVGLSLSGNPYVSYLLRRLTEGKDGPAGFAASRRLVCAEAHRAIFQRHLLLALNELPDTRDGLLKNFLWNEDVIRETLDRISHEGKLTREEVRFLDESGRLKIDYEYRSQRLPAGERRPLDTVGASLVAVRHRAAGFEEEGGIQMRVDPERLTIQAYPHRIFLAGGRRYRVREWSSPEEVVARGWLECRLESVHCWTWRIRNNFVFNIEPSGKPAGIGRSGRLLSGLTVDLHYEEEVIGAINITPDLTAGQAPQTETRRTHPLTQSFATRALVLRFPQAEEPVALSSLCQALRHVLPVHLGVEEDALEVVPLVGESIDGVETYGVAVVDLYPGGIGLIDAVHDDHSLILQLLDWMRTWLESCPCQSDPGCAECLRSPAALAANVDQPPLRSAAVALLDQIV